MGAYESFDRTRKENPAHGARPDRRGFVATVLAAGGAAALAACGGRAGPDTTCEEDELRNPLLWAVAWKETAAEFGALCHQAFNLARWRVEAALAREGRGGRPLAVITDLDDTVLHANSYWGHLVARGLDFFDDAVWDRWIAEGLATPVPGALEFCAFCEANQVEVFYVTNRDQGERTLEHALRQLRASGFPYADEAHLTVYRETSDKTPTIRDVSARYELVTILGDNLNDYRRDYYLTDVEARYAAMERDRYDYGDRFILLPNPTDGHWVRAIFGESEPPPTDENRRRLRDAATRSAWEGI